MSHSSSFLSDLKARGVRPLLRSALQRYSRYLSISYRGSPDTREVALTFDDGPHPVYTEQILDILRSHEAQATFFAVGECVRELPAVLQRIVAEGHTVESHTDSHADLARASLWRTWNEFARSRATLAQVSGRPIRFLRPPWGRMSLATLLVAFLNRTGLVLWSVDSLDSRKLPANELVARIRTVKPQAGDILLFHDDGINTVEALPAILDHLHSQGLKCVTLDQLLRPRAARRAGVNRRLRLPQWSPRAHLAPATTHLRSSRSG